MKIRITFPTYRKVYILCIPTNKFSITITQNSLFVHATSAHSISNTSNREFNCIESWETDLRSGWKNTKIAEKWNDLRFFLSESSKRSRTSRRATFYAPLIQMIIHSTKCIATSAFRTRIFPLFARVVFYLYFIRTMSENGALSLVCGHVRIFKAFSPLM